MTKQEIAAMLEELETANQRIRDNIEEVKECLANDKPDMTELKTKMLHLAAAFVGESDKGLEYYTVFSADEEQAYEDSVVTKEDVKEIALLTKKEYVAKKRFILPIRSDWWLCTPGGWDNCVCYVWGGNGNVSKNGFPIESVFGVRPVLRFNVVNPESFYAGQSCPIGKFMWTVLSVKGAAITALCNEAIMFRKYDETSNDWETSDLKYWLDTEGLKTIF